jgi:hypothetical protein
LSDLSDFSALVGAKAASVQALAGNRSVKDARELPSASSVRGVIRPVFIAAAVPPAK